MEVCLQIADRVKALCVLYKYFLNTRCVVRSSEIVSIHIYLILQCFVHNTHSKRTLPPAMFLIERRQNIEGIFFLEKKCLATQYTFELSNMITFY